MIGGEGRDLPSEIRAFLIGMAEMKPREYARPIDVFCRVVNCLHWRVVPVIPLSSQKATLSVPKNVRRAAATALL